jgi:hypothetical protein
VPQFRNEQYRHIGQKKTKQNPPRGGNILAEGDRQLDKQICSMSDGEKCRAEYDTGKGQKVLGVEACR